MPLRRKSKSYCCLFVCFQVLLQKINIFVGSLFSVCTINLLGPGRKSWSEIEVVVVVHLEVKLGSLYILPYLHGVLLELHGVGSCGEREGVEDEEAGLQGDILEVILS